MSCERALSQLKGVAVSKPGRDAWLFEELYDSLIAVDTSSRVEPTRFRGVYLLFSSAKPREITESILKYRTHSATRVVLASKALYSSSKTTVLSVIKELVESTGARSLRLFYKTRGEGESVISREDIFELLRSLNVFSTPSSKQALALESIDHLFIISLGNTLSCGLRCVLIAPLFESIF
ncbi:MAG: hypothetical protein QXP64_00330 [Acidilobaceae archaeon]